MQLVLVKLLGNKVVDVQLSRLMAYKAQVKDCDSNFVEVTLRHVWKAIHAHFGVPVEELEDFRWMVIKRVIYNREASSVLSEADKTVFKRKNAGPL